jgi:protease-4
LREAIKDFRASGKPVYAYMESGTNKEYYIATAAEKDFRAAAGRHLHQRFRRASDVLSRLARQARHRAGSHQNRQIQKRARPIYRKEMSEGQREVVNAISTIITDEFRRIAETRKKSPEDVKAIIDNAPYNAPQAKQQGLIDGAIYRDEVYDELKNGSVTKRTINCARSRQRNYREVPPIRSV